MINAEYFRAKYEAESKRKGSAVRAEVYLRSGAVFTIDAVRDVEEGYVVLRVHPPEEVSAATRDRGATTEPKAKPGELDLLVVPYESIACVHFAPVGRHPGRAAGF